VKWSSAYWCSEIASFRSSSNPFSQVSRLERPADSVHWYAWSVPANLGRRYAVIVPAGVGGACWPLAGVQTKLTQEA
jgi:hypothetical protein